jgi:hypothetical protein
MAKPYLHCHRRFKNGKDPKMLLAQRGWELPPPSPPRLSQKGQRLPE